MESPRTVLSAINIGNLLLQWGMVLLILIGLIVSVANLRLSPRVRWLAVGFTVLFVSSLASAILGVAQMVMGSSITLQSLSYIQGIYLVFHIGTFLGWILIIVGLGAVFGDFRRR